MNTYLCPIYDGDEIWIEKVNAVSYSSAQDKLMKKVIDMYTDLDVDDTDYRQFIKDCKKESIIIGPIETNILDD